MVKLLAVFILVWGAFSTNPTAAQATGSNGQFYVVQSGDSLYAIVRIHYPEHRGSWLEVAEQLVELNPEAFPQGLDTTLRPGTQLRLSTTPADRNAAATAPPNTTEATGPAQPAGTERPETIRAADEPATAPTTYSAAAQRDASPVSGTRNALGPAARIGLVADITGRVVAVDVNDAHRVLTSGDELFAGDAVHTKDQASASLRMLDDTVYLLRPASSVTFESYDYSPAKREGRAVVTLIKGGFHAIGGSLGKQDSANVTYNTPVATVGVHGTDFSLHFCTNDNCQRAGGTTSFGDGLYTGVLDGTLALTNNSGELLTRKGEFYWVANPANKPQPAPAAAALLFSPDELLALGNHVETSEPLSFWAWLVNFLFGN